MAKEKRQFQRFEVQEIVRVYVLSGMDGKNGGKAPHPPRSPLYLNARNISQEGLCLETKDFLLPNQILRLDFQNTHDGRTEALAAVVWSEKNACGLRFLKDGDPLRRLMDERESA